MSPVVLLMMKSPWAPTRISYVISPFDPSSASTAVSWNWKSQHKSSWVSTFHHHVVFSPQQKKLAFKEKTQESFLDIYTVFLLLFFLTEATVSCYNTKAITRIRVILFFVRVLRNKLWILKAYLYFNLIKGKRGKP